SPGLRTFRPLAAAATVDNIFADLQPVPPGEPPPSEEELARFFD
ncbi:MAG: methyltransferase type 11, partial [Isosphaeraceae bacterium]|nr:methyltransferase type 11 [Isosphaeraceae bacterium]